MPYREQIDKNMKTNSVTYNQADELTKVVRNFLEKKSTFELDSDEQIANPYHTVNYYRLRQWTVQSTARVYTVHYIRLYKPPQETIAVSYTHLSAKCVSTVTTVCMKT